MPMTVMQGSCMSDEKKQVKVAVFSQTQSVIDLCKTEAAKYEALCESYVSFLDVEDPQLQDYQLLVVDVEHPEESGVHWLEKLREFPALKHVPVLLISAFMTDQQADLLRKRYPDGSQIHVRVPISAESLSSMMAYYIQRDSALPLPKAVGAEDVSLSRGDEDENVSLKELYERQVEHERQEDVLSRTGEVIGEVIELDEKKKEKSIYVEKDIEALHRYIEVREKDIARLSEALTRVHSRLDQAYATIDHLRLEITKLKTGKNEARVQYLGLKDEFERFKMSSEQEKQALIEDYQIKLARKEILEKSNTDISNRLEEFKSRMREEVKVVRKHERELEQKLHILQSDTDLLIRAKDERIFDLSKKVEELYEQISRQHDRLQRSEDTVNTQFDRQTRVLKALRLASSLLAEQEEEEKKAG